LSTGVADWQLTGAEPALPDSLPAPTRPADVLVPPDSVWHDLPGAWWISFSPKRASTFIEGTFTYELHFDLCSCLPEPHLWPDFFVDNTAEISLNDMRLGAQTDPRGFEKQKSPLHLEASGQNPNPDAGIGRLWLNPGKNVLQVVVYNQQGPTGFILRGAVEDDCRCGCRWSRASAGRRRSQSALRGRAR